MILSGSLIVTIHDSFVVLLYEALGVLLLSLSVKTHYANSVHYTSCSNVGSY